MVYRTSVSNVGHQPLAVTSDVIKHPLGLIIQAADPAYGAGEFIYLKGVASTAIGDVVEYDNYGGSTTRWAGTAGTGKPLAVAMSANVASQWGWYQISGIAVVNISGTVAAGDKAFWQATGVLSSTQVNGKQVEGAVAVSANAVPAAGQALYQINRPSSQGQIA